MKGLIFGVALASVGFVAASHASDLAGLVSAQGKVHYGHGPGGSPAPNPSGGCECDHSVVRSAANGICCPPPVRSSN